MKKKVDNEKGLTLIELLASMTILSIVLLTFLAFFTNAFRFNTINSDGIQAMNIARAQKAEIWALQDPWHKTPMATILQNKHYELVNNIYTKNWDDDITGYHIKISINDASENSYRKLHVVHVEISKNGKPLSETYTYYEE